MAAGALTWINRDLRHPCRGCGYGQRSNAGADCDFDSAPQRADHGGHDRATGPYWPPASSTSARCSPWRPGATGSRGGWTARAGRPLIYALSLGVYCTSWTYFGSVGIASRTGLDFLPIYLGPILVFALGWKLIQSIADI